LPVDCQANACLKHDRRTFVAQHFSLDGRRNAFAPVHVGLQEPGVWRADGRPEMLLERVPRDRALDRLAVRDRHENDHFSV
jgi:hypothetical protein